MGNIIYHYCSVEAFNAIIQNRTLWLSSVYNLNDYKEIHWIKDKIFKKIKDSITKDNFKLGSWVSHQRVYKKKLTQDKIDKLELLGFIWVYTDELWKKGYEELKKYKKKYKTFSVPKGYTVEGINLSSWVGNQRTRRKKNRLAKNKIMMLDALGFIW